MDWNEAIEKCAEIVELIDDEVPERALEEAPEFFEGIRDKATDMSAWIEENKRITPRMERALINMESGVRKWIRPE